MKRIQPQSSIQITTQ